MGFPVVPSPRIGFNVVNPDSGITELMVVAESGDCAAVIASVSAMDENTRLSRLPGINQKTTVHETNALMFAIEAGQVEMVQLLLTLGADSSQRDKRRFNALHVAIASKNNSVAVVEALRDGVSDDVWKELLASKIYYAGATKNAAQMAKGSPELVAALSAPRKFSSSEAFGDESGESLPNSPIKASPPLTRALAAF